MAKRRKNTNKSVISIIVLIIAVIVALAGNRLGGGSDDDEGKVIEGGEFSVHFIDVGQGDCTLIKSDKGNMLIDAGENGNETAVLNYLSEQGVDTLTYLVASHPHSDHIGGVEEVLENVTVENVIMPKLSASNTPTTKTYENMLLAVQESGAKVIAANPGSEYSFGDVKFTVLSPFEQDDNLNNMSVTLKLTYGNHSFMFTADAEKEVEQQLLIEGYDLNADVYKVAHHGSSTSNTADFINAVNPEFAIISCGADNSYGHPHDEVVETLVDKDIPYYSTAEWGTIVFTADGAGLVMDAVKGDGIEVN